MRRCAGADLMGVTNVQVHRVGRRTRVICTTVAFKLTHRPARAASVGPIDPAIQHSFLQRGRDEMALPKRAVMNSRRFPPPWSVEECRLAHTLIDGEAIICEMDRFSRPRK